MRRIIRLSHSEDPTITFPILAVEAISMFDASSRGALPHTARRFGSAGHLLRRSVPLGLLTLLVMAIPAERASAQGLFQRLRQRLAAPVYPPPAPTPQVAPRGRYQVGPRSADPAARRVAPIAENGSNESSNDGPANGERRSQPDEELDAGDASETQASQDAQGRASLGVEAFERRDGVPGIQIVRFFDQSQADEAGLRPGDLIVSMQGYPTPSIDSMAPVMQAIGVGNVARLRIVRQGRMYEARVPLVAGRPTVSDEGRPTPAPSLDPSALAGPDQSDVSRQASRPRLGPSAANPDIEPGAKPPAVRNDGSRLQIGVELSDRIGQRGAIIRKVASGSPAEVAGLRAGDRVVAVDGRVLLDAEGLIREVSQPRSAAGGELTLRLIRDGSLRDVTVTPQRNLANGSWDLAQSDTTANNTELGNETAPSTITSGGASGTLLQGVGSMLGGLFGGSVPKTAASQPATAPEDAKSSRSFKPMIEDEMAFGDNEPVNQAGYLAPPQPGDALSSSFGASILERDLPPEKRGSMASRQASTKSPVVGPSELPAPQPTAPSAAEQEAEQLRKEIAEMQERLKRLETAD
ncbi:MAG: PDZ domain-containing protein [Planctomycetota bacterium]